MKSLLSAWAFWALSFPPRFAALTAIFAKVGVEGVNSDYATFLRTLVVVAVLALILTAFGEWRPLALDRRRELMFSSRFRASPPAPRGSAIFAR